LLVVVHGSEAGERFELQDGTLLIGRSPDADIQLTDAALGDQHARLTQEHGHWVVVDLGQSAGTFVNNERITEYALRDGDRIRFGRTILKLLSAGDIERRAIDELFRVENLDGLTLASNNATFNEVLARDVNHAQKYRRPLSLVMLDVDGFRKLNETRGEAVGSQVLQRLTMRLRSVLRKQDCLARIGDDDFALLLPATPLADAEGVVEKLRQAAEGEEVTFSAGLTTLSGSEEGAAMLRRARSGMLAAQKAGGNRVRKEVPEKIELPYLDPTRTQVVHDDDDD